MLGMIVVVGVDSAGRFEQGLNLLLRLKLPVSSIHLVHCVEPLLFEEPMSLPFLTLSTKHDSSESYQELLDRTEAMVAPMGVPVKKACLFGHPAQEFLLYAEGIGADLAVIGESDKSELGASVTGSVLRALLARFQNSVLIGKANPKAAGPFSVVIGTSHSEYMRRCMDMYLRWQPSGVDRYTVVTALDISREQLARAVPDSFADDALDWIQRGYEQKGCELCERLGAFDAKCGATVVLGRPNAALGQAMALNAADLLIVGAHGHGFFDRMVTGSVSYHQATAEPYSVLVLRA
jgi:nucleotide-binding universal stress UspA family protein